MADSLLRTAVIGCGAIGRLHADAIRSSGQATLIAACDVLVERAEAVAQGTDARVYQDVTELLRSETLDVVTVATPDHLHVAPTVQALEAGCHVFCEKPLAMTLDEARRMVTAADACGRHLGVDYNRRFGFGYRKARELVSAGRIGEVTHAVLRVTDGIPAFVRGRGPYALLFSLMTHHIDLLRCFGGEIILVHARCSRPDDEGKFCDIVLSCGFETVEGGPIGALIGAWHEGQTRTVERMRLSGTQGSLVVDDVQRGVQVSGLNPDQFETFQPNYFRGEDTAFYDSLTSHLHAFLTAMRAGEAPPVTGRDGVRGLEIVQAAIESHRSGHSVSV